MNKEEANKLKTSYLKKIANKLKRFDKSFQPYKGISYGILSAFFYCISQVILRNSKWLTGSDHSIVRYFLSYFMMYAIIRYKGLSVLGPKDQFALLSLRGFIGSLSLISVSFAFLLINPSDSTTLAHTSLLITGVLSRFLLKEKLTVAHFACLILTVFGVIFIAKPTILFPHKAHIPSFRERLTETKLHEIMLYKSKLNDTEITTTTPAPPMTKDQIERMKKSFSNLGNFTSYALKLYHKTDREHFIGLINMKCVDLYESFKINNDTDHLPEFDDNDKLVKCYSRVFSNHTDKRNSLNMSSESAIGLTNQLYLVYENVYKFRERLSEQTHKESQKRIKLIAGIGLSLFSAFTCSCVFLMLKKLCMSKVHWSTSTIYTCYSGMPISVALSIGLWYFGNAHQNIHVELKDMPKDLLYSSLAATLSTLGQITRNKALLLEDTTKIALTKTTDVFFSIVLQYILLGIQIDLLSSIGAACILTGTFIVLTFKLLEHKYQSYSAVKSEKSPCEKNADTIEKAVANDSIKNQEIEVTIKQLNRTSLFKRVLLKIVFFKI